jgi:small multidrug resistance pump
VSYPALVFAIATNMTGHLLLKAGALAGANGSLLNSLTSLPTLIGIAAYGLSAVAYVAALRTLPLSIAMPSMVAGYAGATIAAAWLWHEPVGIRHAAALALIAAALTVLHR